MATVASNAKGQVTIDGKPALIRGLYISFPPGGSNIGSSDLQAQVDFFKLARFKGKLNAILHIMSGTFDNSLKLADALKPLKMYAVTPGNSFAQWPIDPGNLDVTADRDGFRAKFAAHPQALGVYLTDEPDDTATMLDDVKRWHATYKSDMPNLPTMSVLIGHPIPQTRKWAPLPTGDWLGADPYPIGMAPETGLALLVAP